MNFFSPYKDRAISLGWIAGLLIFLSLLWILTQPLQTHYLQRAVNGVFISTGDSRRLAAPITQNGRNSSLLGYWYSMAGSADRMFVFAVFREGILVPLGAMVSADGKVEEIIPLSAHAVQTVDSLPQSIMRMYVMRIEKAAFHLAGGKNR